MLGKGSTFHATNLVLDCFHMFVFEICHVLTCKGGYICNVDLCGYHIIHEVPYYAHVGHKPFPPYILHTLDNWNFLAMLMVEWKLQPSCRPTT